MKTCYALIAATILGLASGCVTSGSVCVEKGLNPLAETSTIGAVSDSDLTARVQLNFVTK